LISRLDIVIESDEASDTEMRLEEEIKTLVKAVLREVALDTIEIKADESR